MSEPKQLELDLPTWGGRRKGAGRKPTGSKAGVPHRALRPHLASHPLHVTLKLRKEYPRLRTGQLLKVLERCFVAGKDRFLLVSAPNSPKVPAGSPVSVEGVVNDQSTPMELKVMTFKPLQQ